MNIQLPYHCVKPEPRWEYTLLHTDEEVNNANFEESCEMLIENADHITVEMEFVRACSLGDIEKAIKMIDTNTINNIEIGIVSAYEHKQIATIEALGKKAQDINYNWNPEVWDYILSDAGAVGNISTVKLMQYGATDLEHCFAQACRFHKVDIAIYLKNSGAKYFSLGLLEMFFFDGSVVPNDMLYTPHDHEKLIQLLLEWGADWMEAVKIACCIMRPVRNLVEEGTSNYDGKFSFSTGLEYACYQVNTANAREMIYLGATNWNSGLTKACESHDSLHGELELEYKSVINLMLMHGANAGRCGNCKGEKHTFLYDFFGTKLNT